MFRRICANDSQFTELNGLRLHSLDVALGDERDARSVLSVS